MTLRGASLQLLAGLLFLTAGLFGVVPNSVAQDEGGASAATTATTITMEEFALQDGVIKRASGLLIKIVTRGDGGIVDPSDKAIVHYEGRLADGTVFDSSYARGQPAALPVNAVIRGWEEALLLMQIGSKWEIAIPSDIAYGKDGPPGIPESSNLFFTVELLGVR
ncbi:MAG: FKBP-type peptidyl-prolyl cis-trans isomerase [Sphingomonadales bacterium]|nr:FKBP-type peptidyl-prolyl cis-trans isomerase [Sphingomonadales bacterium]